jgi:hypothetical protein
MGRHIGSRYDSRRFTAGCMLAVAALFLLSPAAAASDHNRPPAGELTIDGRGSVIGLLGSYCHEFTDGDGGVVGCADGPWLVPTAAHTTSSHAALTFRLVDDRPITEWSASIGPATETEPKTQLLASESDISSEVVSFAGPGRGDWVLLVGVRYDCCDALYYFRLRVDLPGTSTAADPEEGRERPVTLLLLVAAAAGAMLGWRLGRRSGPISQP